MNKKYDNKLKTQLMEKHLSSKATTDIIKNSCVSGSIFTYGLRNTMMKKRKTIFLLVLKISDFSKIKLNYLKQKLRYYKHQDVLLIPLKQKHY